MVCLGEVVLTFVAPISHEGIGASKENKKIIEISSDHGENYCFGSNFVIRFTEV
jgi:hypothetical protein